MLFHVFNGKVVNRKNSVLSACLDSHVGNCETVIHRQVLNALAYELHRFVKGSVYTDHSDNMKDHILTAYPFLRFAHNIEFDCGRNLEPCFTGSHSSCHISTSNTCGKCSESSVCTGMGVCSDDHIASYRQAFLRKKGMLDSHLSYIKIIGNIVTTGKFTDTFAVFCRLDIFIWNKMIHNKCNFIFIKYSIYGHLIHLMDCNRRSNIISKNKIKLCLYKLSCFYMIQACMSRQNLLSHCHSHFYIPPSYCIMV